MEQGGVDDSLVALEKAHDQIEKLQIENQKLSSENDRLSGRVRKLEGHQDFTTGELTRAEARIKELETRLDEKVRAIKKLNQESNERNKRFEGEKVELIQTIDQLNKKLKLHEKTKNTKSLTNGATTVDGGITQRRATIGNGGGMAAKNRKPGSSEHTIAFPSMPSSPEDESAGQNFDSHAMGAARDLALRRKLKEYETKIVELEQDVPDLIDQVRRLEEEKHKQQKLIDRLELQINGWKSLMDEKHHQQQQQSSKGEVKNKSTARKAGTDLDENRPEYDADQLCEDTLALELGQTRSKGDIEKENTELRQDVMTLENKYKVSERELRSLENEHKKLRDYTSMILERVMDSPFGLQAVLSNDYDPKDLEREAMRQSNLESAQSKPLSIPMSRLGNRSRGNTVSTPLRPSHFNTAGPGMAVVPPSPRESLSSHESNSSVGTRMMHSSATTIGNPTSTTTAASASSNLASGCGDNKTGKGRRLSRARVGHAHHRSMVNIQVPNPSECIVLSPHHPGTASGAIRVGNFPTGMPQTPLPGQQYNSSHHQSPSPKSSATITLQHRNRQPMPMFADDGMLIRPEHRSPTFSGHETARDTAHLSPHRCLGPESFNRGSGDTSKGSGDGFGFGTNGRGAGDGNGNEANSNWRRLSTNFRSWFAPTTESPTA
ncbi:hypothetical protein H4219_001866 [Mycoemilia scoparia]|uniref:Uncharacterized protein n=1 Tax=Mycoemilia scoparia TaxID=417184 RepID=A0A9W8A5K9_9FUNG|nr:hypothetical protein H4219_001866 [Mycoemilia scoparia]